MSALLVKSIGRISKWFSPSTFQTISDSRFPIDDFRLTISDSPFPIHDSRFTIQRPMCGICGAVSLTDAESAMALVRRMTPTMERRGPDDEGYFQSGPLALGMRRLSIIDIAGGHQPIFNEDERVAVILNGEIYNFRELRDQLWEMGHTFSSRADSEVIAHAYEEWGPDCVHHLQGMFAFAVFDGRYAARGGETTLFLARDRMGIKPLYYCWLPRETTHPPVDGTLDHSNAHRVHSSGERTFLFASEVRTLLASGAVARRISHSALESFLFFGSVSEPETLIEDVFSLPPGHRMLIKLDGKLSSSGPECYWNISQAAVQASNEILDRSEAIRQLRKHLHDSVRRHLVSDVPVGVFLSSGIDSTSLAAIAGREIPNVQTLTVAFRENEFNEAVVARRTAAALGTDHQELVLTSEQVLARLDEALAALDQPSIDGVNTYFVSWAAKQSGLKVALSGLGGDEVFGGYSTFRHTPRFERLASLGSHVPEGLRAAMAAAMTGAGDTLAPGDAARKVAAVWNQPSALPDAYYFSRALFTPAQVHSLLPNGHVARSEFLWWHFLTESAQWARRLDDFTAVSCMESQSYLVNTLLRDTDSMSMAHSLEVRVPFLDQALVEFVTRLPESIKFSKSGPKSLLVAAVRDLLPDEVLQKPKRGFTFPWALWLKGPLKTRVDEGLNNFSSTLSDCLDVNEVGKIWKNYLQGHTGWSRPWSLYVLNEWVKRWL